MRRDQVEEAKDYLWELEEQVKQLREVQGDLKGIAEELKRNGLCTIAYISCAVMHIENALAELNEVIESLERDLEPYR